MTGGGPRTRYIFSGAQNTIFRDKKLSDFLYLNGAGKNSSTAVSTSLPHCTEKPVQSVEKGCHSGLPSPLAKEDAKL